MAFSQVDYMDVVSHTGSVMCGVIVTKDIQMIKSLYGNLSNIWHQVIGNTIRILSDKAALMGSDRIEVPEKNNIPWVLVPSLLVSCPKVHQYLFKHALGLAIGISALSLWALLCNRNNGRVAIDCCRG